MIPCLIVACLDTADIHSKIIFSHMLSGSHAAGDAGLQVARYITEPTAAVLAYDIGQEDSSVDHNVVVIHVGGTEVRERGQRTLSVNMRACTCVRVRAYVRTFVCMCMRLCARVCVCICACVRVCMRFAFACMCVHVCMLCVIVRACVRV